MVEDLKILVNRWRVYSVMSVDCDVTNLIEHLFCMTWTVRYQLRNSKLQTFILHLISIVKECTFILFLVCGTYLFDMIWIESSLDYVNNMKWIPTGAEFVSQYNLRCVAVAGCRILWGSMVLFAFWHIYASVRLTENIYVRVIFLFLKTLSQP